MQWKRGIQKSASNNQHWIEKSINISCYVFKN